MFEEILEELGIEYQILGEETKDLAERVARVVESIG